MSDEEMQELPETKEMVEEYRKRREYIEGADFCLRLLNNKGVATVSGETFGKQWTDYIRISYCCFMENLREAVSLIKEYIEEIK